MAEHIYNDDLLIDDASQRQARSEFAAMFHVVDNPELRKYFKVVDQRANARKRTAQRAGFWAVVMTVSGLCIAASEPKWQTLQPHYIPTLLAIGSAALCVLAIAILVGGGLYGKRKDDWLIDRMRTERLRQFQFQTFICRLDDIANSQVNLSASAKAFRSKQREWFDPVKHELDARADTCLAIILGPDALDRLWLHGVGARTQLPAGLDTDELFAAYQKLRLRSQMAYANYKLREGAGTWQFQRMSLKQQKRVLEAAWAAPFVGLILLHVAVVVMYLLGTGSDDVHQWLHIVALWLALVALGARTIEHGLTLSREIERYEDYYASTRDLEKRFEKASAPERLQIMIEMETLSFDEMRNFLRANRDATFVM